MEAGLLPLRLASPGNPGVRKLAQVSFLVGKETWVRSLGQEDPLEQGMATHSSILACRIPWTEETGRLQSMGSQESDVTYRLNHHQKSDEDSHFS